MPPVWPSEACPGDGPTEQGRAAPSQPLAPVGTGVMGAERGLVGLPHASLAAETQSQQPWCPPSPRRLGQPGSLMQNTAGMGMRKHRSALEASSKQDHWQSSRSPGARGWEPTVPIDTPPRERSGQWKFPLSAPRSFLVTWQ